MPGEASRAEDGVMEMDGVDVLLDPAFTVPAVPEAARRIAPDGSEILVDLAAAPFGAGRHACPGQALALHLADAGHP